MTRPKLRRPAWFILAFPGGPYIFTRFGTRPRQGDTIDVPGRGRWRAWSVEQDVGIRLRRPLFRSAPTLVAVRG